jgi:hypothetical protein
MNWKEEDRRRKSTKVETGKTFILLVEKVYHSVSLNKKKIIMYIFLLFNFLWKK